MKYLSVLRVLTILLGILYYMWSQYLPSGEIVESKE